MMRIDSSTPEGLPFILIVMGVSGSGKTTIGQWLSAKLGCSFLDADDFHPPGNVRKMAVGDALTDEDRWPWLEILAGKIRQHIHNKQSMVMACSALKQAYRRVLRVDSACVRFVYLKGDYDTILRRMHMRHSHFMKASLLRSQFEALEEPSRATVVNIEASPSQIGSAIWHDLKL